jgi:hypothetical protein
MKKLNLGLEDLAVESFDTTPVFRRSMGTVRGHMPGGTVALVGNSMETCEGGTCGGSGYYTCEITCHACVGGETDGTCVGTTCFGESCGGAGSCSQGCETQTAC